MMSAEEIERRQWWSEDKQQGCEDCNNGDLGVRTHPTEDAHNFSPKSSHANYLRQPTMRVQWRRTERIRNATGWRVPRCTARAGLVRGFWVIANVQAQCI